MLITLIVALSILFIAERFISAGVSQLALARGPALIAAIALAAVGYGLSSFLMSVAWVRIIRWCGQDDALLLPGLAIYGRTQIAKYLPGNVFHFVGRHLAGRRLGFDHLPMVWAALTEAAGMVSVAAGLGVPLSPKQLLWTNVLTDVLGIRMGRWLEGLMSLMNASNARRRSQCASICRIPRSG